MSAGDVSSFVPVNLRMKSTFPPLNLGTLLNEAQNCYIHTGAHGEYAKNDHKFVP